MGARLVRGQALNTTDIRGIMYKHRGFVDEVGVVKKRLCSKLSWSMEARLHKGLDHRTWIEPEGQ